MGIMVRSLSRRINLRYFNRTFSGTAYRTEKENRDSGNELKGRWIYSLLGASFGYYIYDLKKKYALAQGAVPQEGLKVGQFKEGLPTYTMEDVAEHSEKNKSVWVIYKEGVYDVTKFIEEHPGGDQILMAAGSSVEPFWQLYQVHENQQVYNILESHRIGNLSKEEVGALTIDMSDPYCKDPKRHPALKPTSKKPFNAETHPSILVDSFITPNELFYVRNHLPVPEVDPNTYELEIEVEGKKTISFSLDELKKFPKRTITATLMCAGNRRSEMTKVKPVKGLNWGAAAIGTAQFSGVFLRDLFKLAGVEDDSEDYKHVQFEGLDSDATGRSYGASIPLWRALDRRGDVLLAYEMNGVPIPRDHGFPIRVIVPGVVGARNVKWLSRIIVSPKESDSHWQQNDYKGFSPTTDWDSVDFSKSPAIQELPVISAICKPSDGEKVLVKDGFITLKGYAWSGGGQKIVRVDVTSDKGKTWQIANLDQDSTEPPKHWSWTIWEVKIPVDKKAKNVEVWAKAVDSSYNTQPESFSHIWNLRGVLGNAYHRITIELQH